MKATDSLAEIIHVELSVTALADRRTRAFLKAVYGPDALAVLMRSCYVQGLQDGYDAAQHRALAAPQD